MASAVEGPVSDAADIRRAIANVSDQSKAAELRSLFAAPSNKGSTQTGHGIPNPSSTPVTPFVLLGIVVLRVRNGEIVSSRDYFDHLIAARTRGQLDRLVGAVKAAVTASASHGDEPSTRPSEGR